MVAEKERIENRTVIQPIQKTYKTVVLGNGFDLNLNLPTSYKDFIASPIFEETRNKGNKLCEYVYKRYKGTNWVDIENILKEYAKKGVPEKDFFNEYENLKTTLKDYVKSIETNILVSSDKSKAMSQIVGDICMDTTIRRENVYTTILNFNYTNSIGFVLCNKYSWLKDCIDLADIVNFADIPIELHNVHGTVNTDIILGVEDTADIPVEYNFIKKTYSKSYRNYTNKLLACDELVIFGHSLGETDESEFRPFFQQQISDDAISKKIIIWHKGEDGRRELIHRLDALTDNQTYRLRRRNHVEFRDVDTYESPFLKDLANAIGLLHVAYNGIRNIFKQIWH